MAPKSSVASYLIVAPSKDVLDLLVALLDPHPKSVEAHDFQVRTYESLPPPGGEVPDLLGREWVARKALRPTGDHLPHPHHLSY